MPKVFESEVIYDYQPLHTLNWLHRKYPNPFATHVQTVDTLSRSVDTATGIIRSERLIGVQQGAPKWVAKLLSLPPTAYVREIIFIDPSAPSATCMSVNLDLKQYVSCLELIRYLPSSTEPSSTAKPGDIGPGASSPSTLFTQRAMITSGFSSSMIAKRLEKASVDRFAGNAGVGRKGFEWVLAGGSEGSCG